MVVVPSLLTLNLEVFCAHGLFSSVECKFFWHILNRKKKNNNNNKKQNKKKNLLRNMGLTAVLMFLAIVLHKFQTYKRANHSKTACNKIGCILKERNCQQLGFFQRYARLSEYTITSVLRRRFHMILFAFFFINWVVKL